MVGTATPGKNAGFRSQAPMQFQILHADLTNHDYFSVLQLDATQSDTFFGAFIRGACRDVKERKKMVAMEYILDMIWTPINGGLGKVCHLNLYWYWTYSANNRGIYVYWRCLCTLWAQGWEMYILQNMYFVRYLYSRICTYIREY